jgi:hypothetical protein
MAPRAGVALVRKVNNLRRLTVLFACFEPKGLFRMGANPYTRRARRSRFGLLLPLGPESFEKRLVRIAPGDRERARALWLLALRNPPRRENGAVSSMILPRSLAIPRLSVMSFMLMFRCFVELCIFGVMNPRVPMTRVHLQNQAAPKGAARRFRRLLS